MPMPLIATDLDGTLLMSGTSEPHPDAVAAIHRAIAAGIPIVFATGRPPVDVAPIADLVGHRWFAVCNDGTALVDLHREEVFETHAFGTQQKFDIVRRLREQFSDVRFLVDRVAKGPIEHHRWGLVIESGFPAPWAEALAGATTVADIEEVLDDPNVVKICAYRPASGVTAEAFAAMATVWGIWPTPVRIHSEETFMDMCPHGISKATGVAAIADAQASQRIMFLPLVIYTTMPSC